LCCSSRGCSARFSCSCSRHLRALRSFPPRRSSDLKAIVRHYQSLPAREVNRMDPVQLDRSLAQIRSRLETEHGTDQLDFYHPPLDRKSTRLNSSHVKISYAVFCLKKKKTDNHNTPK